MVTLIGNGLRLTNLSIASQLVGSRIMYFVCILSRAVIPQLRAVEPLRLLFVIAHIPTSNELQPWFRYTDVKQVPCLKVRATIIIAKMVGDPRRI